MTNNPRLRNASGRKSRPKSWCAASTRADPGFIKNHNTSSRASPRFSGVNEKASVCTVNNEFIYLKYASRNTAENTANVANYDGNNNLSNENIPCSAKYPKVIRRTNVDRATRRAVVSLNLSNKENCTYVGDQFSTLSSKKSRPKSMYQNFFRRSCSLLKSHVFGNSSKYEPLGSNHRKLDPFQENMEISSGNEYTSIITDGESCIFSNIHIPLNDEGNQWTLWCSSENMFQGVSLETGVPLHETANHIKPTETYISNLMPWTKRKHSATMPDQEVLALEPFQCRRDNKRYASLRSPSKSKGGTSPKCSPCENERINHSPEQFSPIKRNSIENNKLSNNNNKFNRVGSARYYRPNSVDNSTFRRKTINFTTPDRLIDDNLKNLNPKTLKTKKGETRNAPNFFIRYNDVLREEKLTATPPMSYRYENDSSKFTQLNDVFEYLLNLHCTKPVTKTCKQLFYIRSRLSKTARRNDSMCDGCFGCGKENIALRS